VNRYIVKPIRVAAYLVDPIVIGIFMLWLYDYLNPILNTTIGRGTLYFIVGFILVYSIPQIVLLIDHMLYFRYTTFEFDELSSVYILKRNNTFISIPKTEVVSITKYSAFSGQIPWSGVCIWEIKSRKCSIILAPVIISETNVRKIFAGIPFEWKNKFFVWI